MTLTLTLQGHSRSNLVGLPICDLMLVSNTNHMSILHSLTVIVAKGNKPHPCGGVSKRVYSVYKL